MSKLALGSVQFGLDYGVSNYSGQVQTSEVEKILSVAKLSGINVVDTAIGYGSSEEVLGKVGVGRFQIVTKVPPPPIDLYDVSGWVFSQVEASRKRLRKDEIYGILFHRSRDLLGPQGAELLRALVELKEVGVLKKIGVSIYSPNELDSIYNKVHIDLIQSPLNVIDRRLETSGWLDRLKSDGVEVHARSVFLQGLLLMERDRIPQKFLRWSQLWDQWHQMLSSLEASPVAVSLAYPLSLEQVDQVIVGVHSAAQLTEILTAVENKDKIPDTSFMCSTDLDLVNPSNWDHI